MNNSLPVSLLEKARHAKLAATEYLRGRQCSNGGFCFYRSEDLEEPNLGDTYHAVAAFGLIGAQIPNREKVVAFLEDSAEEGRANLFFYAFTLDLLGLRSTLGIEQIRQIERLSPGTPADESVLGVSTWLEDTARVVRLQRCFAQVSASDRYVATVARFEHDGGFGVTPNILDTWSALSILKAVGKFEPPSQTRGFVRDMQLLGYGFVTAPGAAATSLEAMHAGVCCCRLLDVAIEYPADVLEFVLGCQSRDGAFARQSVALPDIELTHQALEVIEAIVGEHSPEECRRKQPGLGPA